MNIDTKKASQILLDKDNILILTHKSPDGDTLGSGYGLCRALKKINKKAKVVCHDEIPKKFKYLYQDMKEDDFSPSFIVAVDVADTKLLGKTYEEKYGDKVDLCIDHHGSNIYYAKDTCLYPNDAAATETIYAIIKHLNIEIDKDIANCIYTGLSTDTGCFRYSNTTAKTHRIAAEMIEAGAKAADINCSMFESKTISFLNLQKLCIDGMGMYFNDKCALITLTQNMYNISGADESECDSVSSLARQIEGVLVGATMKERVDGTFKVSIRTHYPIDASEICKKMNGGGHKRAGGCEIKLPLKEAKEVLLGHIENALKEACKE